MKLDMHYLFSSKYAKWVILFFIVFFSLLIIFEYATLFFSVDNPAVLVALDKTAKDSSKSDIAAFISNTSLFGVYVPENLNEDNVQKSMLDATVVGILLADTPEDSQIIIRSANGVEKTYKLNDKIPGGAVIKRIMAGGVLVERNGTLERLSLPKNDLTFEPVAKPLKEE